MSQIVENWSDLRARVVRVTRAGDAAVELTVEVVEVEPVPGYPNLLDAAAGDTITLRYPLGENPAPRPGDDLRSRVRKAGPDRYFAHPAAGGSATGG